MCKSHTSLLKSYHTLFVFLYLDVLLRSIFLSSRGSFNRNRRSSPREWQQQPASWWRSVRAIFRHSFIHSHWSLAKRLNSQAAWRLPRFRCCSIRLVLPTLHHCLHPLLYAAGLQLHGLFKPILFKIFDGRPCCIWMFQLYASPFTLHPKSHTIDWNECATVVFATIKCSHPENVFCCEYYDVSSFFPWGKEVLSCRIKVDADSGILMAGRFHWIQL